MKIENNFPILKGKQITVHTEGWFDASHYLENYKGACAQFHGHTYKVEVWVRGQINQLQENGILWDFSTLKKMLKKFDHSYLNQDYNENPEISNNSTAEIQASIIYAKLAYECPHLQFRVRLYEQIAPKQSYAEIGDF